VLQLILVRVYCTSLRLQEYVIKILKDSRTKKRRGQENEKKRN
jgi:hypothetical protein